jgi:hypothetical protein
MRQEMYVLSQIGNANQTPVLFDMPRNNAVQQKGRSAVLNRTLGLYYNAKTFLFKFMNTIPVSGPNVIVTSKTTPSKNSSHIFTPHLFGEKIGKKCAKIMRVNTVHQIAMQVEYLSN